MPADGRPPARVEAQYRTRFRASRCRRRKRARSPSTWRSSGNEEPGAQVLEDLPSHKEIARLTDRLLREADAYGGSDHKFASDNAKR